MIKCWYKFIQIQTNRKDGPVGTRWRAKSRSRSLMAAITA